MKKIILMLILQMFLGISVIAQTTSELKTVQNVDLKRYSGKWFEIARYENKFQKKCVGNTTATYTIKAEKSEKTSGGDSTEKPKEASKDKSESSSSSKKDTVSKKE